MSETKGSNKRERGPSIEARLAASRAAFVRALARLRAATDELRRETEARRAVR